MKRILFVLLCIFASNMVQAAGYDRSIALTVTVGVPFTLTPSTDLGLSPANVMGQFLEVDGKRVEDLYYVSDPSACTISYTTSKANSRYQDAYVYTFTITATKAGTFVFKKGFLGNFGNVSSGATVTYTINAIDVSSINIPSVQTLTVGDTYAFSPVIIPTNATPALSWSSTNPSVASVDNNGKVEALSEGTATITCMANNGVSASCVVTVKPRMNYLYSADFSGGAGGHVTVPILMKNDINVAGFQFDLTMPEGVTLTLKEDGTADATVTERTSTHTLSGTTTASGAVRFTAFSTKNALVTGTEGAVMNIRFDVDKNMAHGDYDVKFTNVQLTQKNGSDLTTVYAPDFTLKMSVGAIALGDVNADGVVNVTDAISIIGYIVEERPTWFTESVADVNGDGFIDVADVVSVIDIVLSQE